MTQPADHACFDADWLTLREPVDHASRDSTLTQAAAAWLRQPQADPASIVDLGSGHGSNLRYLAPRLPGPQHWRLIDHDRRLLDAAVRTSTTLSSADGQRVVVDCETADIGTRLGEWIDGAVLVTATALFDLVSAEWIERLVAACAAQRAAVLFAMSVNGHLSFEGDGRTANDAEDRFIFSLLAAHQQHDKGFGPALGSAAPGVLMDALDRAGYRVQIADSPWHLDRATTRLAAALIEGWRAAAVEQAPSQRALIADWADRRVAAISAGQLDVTVAHRDVYAQPATPFSP